MNGWSTATGFSEVYGTLLYLILYKIFKLKLFLVRALIRPTVSSAQYSYLCTLDSVYIGRKYVAPLVKQEESIALFRTDGVLISSNNDEGKLDLFLNQRLNSKPSCGDMFRSLKIVFPIAFHYSMVYALQTVILYSFLPKIVGNIKENTDPWKLFAENGDLICILCYEFGMMIARTSMGFTKAIQFWVFTVLQSANAVVFYLEAYIIPHDNMIVVMVHCFIVGLVTGSLYGNVFLLLYSHSKINDKDKDLAICMCQII